MKNENSVNQEITSLQEEDDFDLMKLIRENNKNIQDVSVFF